MNMNESSLRKFLSHLRDDEEFNPILDKKYQDDNSNNSSQEYRPKSYCPHPQNQET